MKKLIITLIFLFASIITGTYYTAQNKNNIFSCHAEWLEDRISDHNLMLNTHVSILLDTNKMTGVISSNGNIYHNEQAYKIKRSLAFNFYYVGNFIKLKNTHEIITKEDTAPDSFTKYFYLLTDDISFNALTMAMNQDKSFTLYNSHEPILVCSP